MQCHSAEILLLYQLYYVTLIIGEALCIRVGPF